MSVLKTAWANLQDGLGNRFSWSHVKAIFYNYAEQKLLSTKLDEMDALIDEKIAKAMMSNVQVNDQTKVPTSALAYSMNESITKLNSDLKWKYYSQVSQIGLSDTSTITFDQILTSMTDYSILEFAAFKSDYPVLNLPGSGQKHKIKVVYPLAGYAYLEDIDLSNNVIYINRHDGNNYSGWSAFSCNPMSALMDCNLTSANASGVYYFSLDTANTPIPTTYGMLKHYVTCGGAWLFQEATLVDNRTYVRSNIDASGWSGWEEK